jgi:hypothetical protein
MASLTHPCRRAGAPVQLSDKQQEDSRPLRGPVGITEKHSPPRSQIPGRHGWRPNEGAGSLIEPKRPLIPRLIETPIEIKRPT